MTDHTPKTPFFCLKLKSGETLLSEVQMFNDDQILSLVEPFLLVEEKSVSDGNVMMVAIPWIPYSNNAKVRVPVSQVYYFDYLNERYKKFYGQVLLQSKITEIKESIEDEMEDGNDYYLLCDGLERIKLITNQINEKFNTDLTIDTTMFEKKLEEFKYKMH